MTKTVYNVAVLGRAERMYVENSIQSGLYGASGLNVCGKQYTMGLSGAEWPGCMLKTIYNGAVRGLVDRMDEMILMFKEYKVLD